MEPLSISPFSGPLCSVLVLMLLAGSEFLGEAGPESLVTQTVERTLQPQQPWGSAPRTVTSRAGGAARPGGSGMGFPKPARGGGHRRTAPRPSGLLSLSLMRAGGQPVASAGPCPFLPRPRPLTRKTFPRGGQSHRGQSERELGGTEAPGDTSCLLLVVLQRWPPPGCWETLTRIRETASPPRPPRPPVPGEVSSRRGGWGASP